MMVREPPPLRIRPRLEVGDRAAQQPVVVVGLVERDKVLDGVDDVRMTSAIADRPLHNRRSMLAWPRMPELSFQSTRGVGLGALPVHWK